MQDNLIPRKTTAHSPHWQQPLFFMSQKSLMIAVLLCCLIGFCLAGSRSNAQSTREIGFFFRAAQTIYRWDGDTAHTLITLPQPLLDVSISPTATHLVYRVQSSAYDDEIARECPCGGLVLPTELYLLDIETGTTSQIASQPAGATLATSIVYSQPLWSPDGMRLAWAEGVEAGSLLVYDLASGDRQIIVEELPAQSMTPAVHKLLAWTQTGITVPTYNYDAQSGEASGYRFYAVDGTVLFDIPAEPDAPLYAFHLSYDGREKFARYTLGAGWLLFDLQTGAEESVSGGTIYRFASSAPQQSMRIGARMQHDDGTAHWMIMTLSGEMTQLPMTYAPRFLIGNSSILMKTQGETISLWSAEGGEQIITLPVVPDVIYSETGQYEFIPDANMQTVHYGNLCAGGQRMTRMFHSTGWVSGGVDSTIYAEPDDSSPQAGSIPAGDWFTMMSNIPVCHDGAALWQVSYNGLTGWLVEGDAARYFLTPGCPPTGCARG